MSEHPRHASDQDGRNRSVFLFNPFAEGYIALGKAFTPVQPQLQLAADLENLPQFLASDGDVVITRNPPRAEHEQALESAGFPRVRFAAPECLPDLLRTHEFRPWAWSPDLAVWADKGLQGRMPSREAYELFSKAWSATFLERVLAETGDKSWLCTASEVGITARDQATTLQVVGKIRRGGHHRLVVKQALGVAGKNAIRLWEPEVLPTQKRWMENVFAHGGELVIEPWLERLLDFSVQMAMQEERLVIRGYTGLTNDLKGQYIGNWVAPGFAEPPAQVASLLGAEPDIKGLFETIRRALEPVLQRMRFMGPLGIDAFIYRDQFGQPRLKPVVEINPRQTLGSLTLELMRFAAENTFGWFALVNQAMLRKLGYRDFLEFREALRSKSPWQVTKGAKPVISSGTICLNDPERAQANLAVFQAGGPEHPWYWPANTYKI